MPELTNANIEVIIREVSDANITFSHLREELIDHICCEVENIMQQGFSFQDAFDNAKKMIGNKGLKKIQEDTLLLIDKKYRLMKKTMKIIGWISMSMITVGALFKIQHWPGAGILLVFGFLFLGAIFFPSALWVMKKESKLKGNLFIYLISIIGGIIFIFGILFKVQHYPGSALLLIIGFLSIGLVLIPAILISKLRDAQTKNLHLVYIIGAVSLIFFLIGVLFKFQHWPGALPCLIIGSIGITTVFLPLYTWKVYRNSESIKAGFLFLCVGIVFFNMFNLLLALNISKNVMSFFVIQGKEITNTANILQDKCNALSEKIITDSLVSDTLLKSNVIKVKAISDELYDFIEEVKVDLISKVDGIDNKEAIDEVKNTALIIAKDNYDIPTILLCGNTDNGKSGKASLIKTKIENLKNSLSNYCRSDINAENIITKALETESPVFIKEEGRSFSWELYNFYHLTTISTINKLCFFQRNVRIAELETLESIKSSYLANIQKLTDIK